MVGWIEKKIDDWMDKKQMKNIWMVGRIKKLLKKIYGWLEG